MNVTTTSDSPVWFETIKIREELLSLDAIIKKYDNFPFNLGFCLRALSDDSGWKSKARHYTDSNYLDNDIVVSRSDLEPFRNDIESQRKIFGKEFINFFPKTMKKYEKKFPVLKEINPTFLPEVEQWLKDNQWID